MTSYTNVQSFDSPTKTSKLNEISKISCISKPKLSMHIIIPIYGTMTY